MSEGQCSLEHDFATLLKSDTEQATSVAELQLQDVAISVTKSTTSECWTLTQSNVVVSIMPDSTEVSVAGVLSEPEGNHGSMQSSIQLATASADQDGIHWSLTLNCESLPISVAELLLTRFPEMATGIPGTIRGDATGIISAAGKSNGTSQQISRISTSVTLSPPDMEIPSGRMRGQPERAVVDRREPTHW